MSTSSAPSAASVLAHLLLLHRLFLFGRLECSTTKAYRPRRWPCGGCALKLCHHARASWSSTWGMPVRRLQMDHLLDNSTTNPPWHSVGDHWCILPAVRCAGSVHDDHHNLLPHGACWSSANPSQSVPVACSRCSSTCGTAQAGLSVSSKRSCISGQHDLGHCPVLLGLIWTLWTLLTLFVGGVSRGRTRATNIVFQFCSRRFDRCDLSPHYCMVRLRQCHTSSHTWPHPFWYPHYCWPCWPMSQSAPWSTTTS